MADPPMFKRSYVTNHVLDNFVSPNLSKIDTCEAEDIDEPSEHIPALLLNSMFVFRPSPKNLAFIINYVHRVDEAVLEYKIGRSIFIELCSKKNQLPTLCYRCTYHFIQSINLLCQSIPILRRHIEFIGAAPYPPYTKGEGSTEERLNWIYITWKHSYDRITDGILPEDGLMPVWLDKNGIRSKKYDLSFSEPVRKIQPPEE